MDLKVQKRLLRRRTWKGARSCLSSSSISAFLDHIPWDVIEGPKGNSFTFESARLSGEILTAVFMMILQLSDLRHRTYDAEIFSKSNKTYRTYFVNDPQCLTYFRKTNRGQGFIVSIQPFIFKLSKVTTSVNLNKTRTRIERRNCQWRNYNIKSLSRVKLF